MINATGLGVVLTAVLVWFALDTYQRHGVGFALFSSGLGLFVAQVIFWTGAVTLAVGRLHLVLDRDSGTGEFRVRSPLIDAGKSCKFDLDDVHAVTIETVRTKRPHYDVVVYHARLVLDHPRRMIVLEESQNEQIERVQEIAATVAEFLGKKPERISEDSA